VGNDVVELAGNPDPLLGDGCARFLLSFALKLDG
jgi:hypothetical protein